MSQKMGTLFVLPETLRTAQHGGQTRQAANQSPEPKNQLHCNLIQACGGNARLPKGRAFSFSCKKTSHDFSCARISVISFSSKTMHAVESASDSAAVSVKAQARFCRRAGSPVRGSKICFPFTARPEPLNEQFFNRKRSGELSSPRPHDQPFVSGGASPAKILLPPATSKNAAQSHSRKTSAMRSSAKPFPIAPRSNSSFPLSQRTENSFGSKVHCGKAD